MSERVIARRLWQCPSCGKRYRIPAAAPDPGLCPDCQPDVDSETSEETLPVIAATAGKPARRNRIGGWMLIPVWYFLFALIFGLPMGVLDSIFRASDSGGHPLALAIVAVQGAFLAFSFYVATRLLRQKRDAPALMMAWYAAWGLLQLLGQVLFGEIAAGFVLLAVAACAVLYFANSRRVKDTFVLP